MRPVLFLLFVLLLHDAKAQNSPALKFMKKKAGQVLKVKITEGLADPHKAGAVVVEIEETYKSSKLKTGDKIAIYMQPYTLQGDSSSNHLIPGTELIVFLSKEKPRSYSRSSTIFPLYHLYDDWAGWIFFNESVSDLLKAKK